MSQHLLHVRRCHICGHTTEADHNIQRCGECDKPFAPFYYFDDQSKPILADCTLRPPAMQGEWKAIQGLTAYWEGR